MITPPQADGDSRVPVAGPGFLPYPPSAAGADRRLATLDVLRGVAVLGILLMNIQSFGLISSQYVNPKALGSRRRWTGWSG